MTQEEGHNSTILVAASLVFLGIIFIWIAVNIVEPTQGIFLTAGTQTAIAMGQPTPTITYTPDYTVLFVGPVMASLLYVYMKNKQQQMQHEAQNNFGEQPVYR